MNITHLSAHWKRLFSAKAIPGWAVLGWKLLTNLSTLQFCASIVARLRSHLASTWTFFTSPVGNVVLIIGGLLWLLAVVFWPHHLIRSKKAAERDKTWADAIVEDDAKHIKERVRSIKQRFEFHPGSGSDPYIDVITELWNGTVFTLVSFGEIAGHVVYGGKQVAGEPRVIVSVEPPLLNLAHGDSATLVVRQYLSYQVADTMCANRDRGIAINFESVFVPFKILPLDGFTKMDTFRWQGPRFAIEDTKRV